MPGSALVSLYTRLNYSGIRMIVINSDGIITSLVITCIYRVTADSVLDRKPIPLFLSQRSTSALHFTRMENLSVLSQYLNLN